MKKEKWKAFTEKLKEKSQFLKLDDDDIDLEDEMQMEEEPLSAEELLLDDTPEENLEERLARNRKWVFRRRLAIVVLLAAIAGGFVLYNQFHTFEDYIIAKSYEKEASSGTQYKEAGKNLYRYNSDGISCVTRENELKWSITYNMQAPIADVCDTTMAVAEQQGNQVYVVNKDGLVGSFRDTPADPEGPCVASGRGGCCFAGRKCYLGKFVSGGRYFYCEYEGDDDRVRISS